MNKNVMIALGIVLLLLVGAGSFVAFGNKSKTADTTVNTDTETQTASEDSGSQKQSLMGLMRSTIAQKCAFTDTETNSSGTVYTGGGQMRGDFVSSANGQATTSHMVADSTTVYVWVEGEAQGFKAAKDAAEKVAGSSGQKSFDVNKQVDYTCVPWIVENNMFDIPTNVTFTDFSGMMQQFSASGSPQNGNMKAIQCAACDGLAGDEQVQCKQALGC